MSVKFNVVERGNPSNLEAPKKFYASVVSTGRRSLRQLAGRISEISTVSSADTMAVLEALLMVIPQELAQGNVVELGEFGSFWLKVSSEGSEAATDVRAGNITNVLPRFNPGKEFKKVLDVIEFQKAPTS